MAKRTDHIQRRKAKQAIAEIVNTHVHQAFDEAVRAAVQCGSPRSHFDFCHWFVESFNERLSCYPNFKRGEQA